MIESYGQLIERIVLKEASLLSTSSPRNLVDALLVSTKAMQLIHPLTNLVDITVIEDASSSVERMVADDQSTDGVRIDCIVPDKFLRSIMAPKDWRLDDELAVFIADRIVSSVLAQLIASGTEQAIGCPDMDLVAKIDWLSDKIGKDTQRGRGNVILTTSRGAKTLFDQVYLYPRVSMFRKILDFITRTRRLSKYKVVSAGINANIGKSLIKHAYNIELSSGTPGVMYKVLVCDSLDHDALLIGYKGDQSIDNGYTVAVASVVSTTSRDQLQHAMVFTSSHCNERGQNPYFTALHL